MNYSTFCHIYFSFGFDSFFSKNQVESQTFAQNLLILYVSFHFFCMVVFCEKFLAAEERSCRMRGCLLSFQYFFVGFFFFARLKDLSVYFFDKTLIRYRCKRANGATSFSMSSGVGRCVVFASYGWFSSIRFIYLLEI